MADINETQQQPKESVYQSIMEVVIETESMAAAKKRIEEFGKGFDNVTKALGDLGISSGKVVNTFKGFGESVVGINELTQAIKNARNEQERLNAERDLSVAKTGLLKKGLEALSDVFKYNVRSLNAANKSWEDFRRANLMTSSELNEVAGSFERAGAAALLSSEESSQIAMNFKTQGLMLSETNKSLIETTGKIATVFNVELGRATTFIARQYQYLGITEDKLKYGMGQMIPTMKHLGMTGEEALSTFGVLGDTISLIFGRGDKQGFAFTESMFRLTGVMKSMGLSSSGVSNQIKGVMNAEIDAIRANVLIASQMGMSYEDLMRQMIDMPEQFAVTQAEAFQKSIAGFDKYRAEGMMAIKNYANLMHIPEDEMMKMLRDPHYLDKLKAKLEEERKFAEEYKKSGGEELDKAFQTQLSSFTTGWTKLKHGFQSFWNSSLRPILGKFLAVLGDVLGKLGKFFGTFSKTGAAGTIGLLAASITTLAGALGFVLSPLLKLKTTVKEIKGFMSGEGFIGKMLGKFGGTTSTGAKLGKTFVVDGIELTEIAEAAPKKMGWLAKTFGKNGWIGKALPELGELASAGKWMTKLKPMASLLGKLAFFIEPILMVVDFFTTKGDWKTKLGTALTGSKEGGFKGAFSGALRWASLGATVGGVIALFTGGLGTPLAIAGGIIGAIFGAVMGGVGGQRLGKLMNIGGGIGGVLGSVLGMLLGPPGMIIGGILGFIIGGAMGNNPEIRANFSSFFGGLVGEAKKPFKDLAEATKAIISAFKIIFGPMKQALEPAVEVLEKTFGVKGSDTFKKVGQLFAFLLITMSPLIVALKIFAGTLIMLSEMQLKAKRLFASDEEKVRIDKALAELGVSKASLGIGGSTQGTTAGSGGGQSTPAKSKVQATAESWFGGSFIKNPAAWALKKTTGVNLGSVAYGVMSKASKDMSSIIKGDTEDMSSIIKGDTEFEPEQLNNYFSYDNGKALPGYWLEGWKRTNPKMISALAKFGALFQQNNPKAKIDLNDGFRTYEEQVEMVKKHGLYKKGMGGAAPPGTSPHEKGKAIDINRGLVSATNPYWSAAGFTKPMSDEPWHLQLAAEGAVVTKPTMTLMGERETELIAPLSKIDSIMTSVIQKAIGTVGKTALPSTGPLMSIINSLIALQKEQLNVQKNILAAIVKQGGPSAVRTASHDGKSMEDIAMMRWALPPLE